MFHVVGRHTCDLTKVRQLEKETGYLRQLKQQLSAQIFKQLQATPKCIYKKDQQSVSAKGHECIHKLLQSVSKRQRHDIQCPAGCSLVKFLRSWAEALLCCP